MVERDLQFQPGLGHLADNLSCLGLARGERFLHADVEAGVEAGHDGIEVRPIGRRYEDGVGLLSFDHLGIIVTKEPEGNRRILGRTVLGSSEPDAFGTGNVGGQGLNILDDRHNGTQISGFVDSLVLFDNVDDDLRHVAGL